jgi:hypothetical protein
MTDVTDVADQRLEHVLPAVRDPLEQAHGVTYCRRCGSVVVNDRYPDRAARPCRKVKVTLR